MRVSRILVVVVMVVFYQFVTYLSRILIVSSAYNDYSITFDDRSWWRHQIKTFSALLAICTGNSPVPGELPAQRPVTRSFHVFFDLRLNNPLSKHSWGWWFETLSRPLWRHCNVWQVLQLVMDMVNDINLPVCYIFVTYFHWSISTLWWLMNILLGKNMIIF